MGTAVVVIDGVQRSSVDRRIRTDSRDISPIFGQLPGPLPGRIVGFEGLFAWQPRQHSRREPSSR